MSPLHEATRREIVIQNNNYPFSEDKKSIPQRPCSENGVKGAVVNQAENCLAGR